MEAIEREGTPEVGKIGASAIWTYMSAIGIALVAGIVFDKIGSKPALALTVTIPFVLLSIRNFKVVCSMAILVLPLVPTFLLSKQGTSFSGIRLMVGLLMLAIICIFFSCALRPKQVKLPQLPVMLVLYLAVIFLAALNGTRFFGETPDYLQSLNAFQGKTTAAYLTASLFVPALLIGTAIIAGVLYANTTDSRWVILPMICASVIMASIVYFFALKANSSLSEMAGQESRQYLSGSGQHANEIGLTLNMALAITLFVFAATSNWKSKLVLGCCLLVQCGAVFLTFSRGAYAGAATIVIYFIFTHKGQFWARSSLLVLLACTILVMPGSLLNRTGDDSMSADVDEVSSGRVDEIWRPLIPELLKNPAIGRGHGSILWSDAAKKREILPVGHPHSAYLAALLDTGMIGTIVILAFLMHAWRMFWRLCSSVRPKIVASFFHGASACIPVLLVQGLTDDAFTPRYTHAFLWIAYGAALGLVSRRNFIRSSGFHVPPARKTAISKEEK